ncbi:hypothetical protein GWK47_044718 [Chionoecetes opilio]|uniref:Uncharacterized protein n=1 Tax=Chionoecetes opilio TaxID=41210 RepID=A0A8J4YIY3_CHIOP|nr:hypothetical protein GWK47_044718 [Chionoecetes opilio]
MHLVQRGGTRAYILRGVLSGPHAILPDGQPGGRAVCITTCYRESGRGLGAAFAPPLLQGRQETAREQEPKHHCYLDQQQQQRRRQENRNENSSLDHHHHHHHRRHCNNNESIINHHHAPVSRRLVDKAADSTLDVVFFLLRNLRRSRSRSRRMGTGQGAGLGGGKGEEVLPHPTSPPGVTLNCCNVTFFLLPQGHNGFDELRRYIKSGGEFCKELATIMHERRKLYRTPVVHVPCQHCRIEPTCTTFAITSPTRSCIHEVIVVASAWQRK